ncbi:transferrin-binding protein-like solute binding protein [Moraxella nasovis]|uniref:Slam-dependent surface lipoprotein n=1 Tax=Moraxella nasovis TaxID=2904121 RepID=UPI001F5FFB61|nr:Slam-dependent surface lipoprotein [Moraxella nasovis]UNU72926.1 transferrin-binding protein-like solute binding protein [Moraxella nasovis]
MKLSQSSLSVAVLSTAVLALTACSSGGHSSSTTVTKTTTVPSTITGVNTTPTKADAAQSNTANNPTTAKFQGGSYVVQGKSVTSKTLGTDDINNLVIDGKSFPIAFSGINAGGFTNINGDITSGNHVSHVKYGVKNDSGKKYYFYQGQRTTNMPTTGIATYKGRAVVGNGSDGTSNFTVNFADKTLAGVITDKSLTGGSLALSANIKGNTFAGNKNGVQTEGAFFGDNAAELAGIYQGKGAIGAFGAKKSQ